MKDYVSYTVNLRVCVYIYNNILYIYIILYYIVLYYIYILYILYIYYIYIIYICILYIIETSYFIIVPYSACVSGLKCHAIEGNRSSPHLVVRAPVVQVQLTSQPTGFISLPMGFSNLVSGSLSPRKNKV